MSKTACLLAATPTGFLRADTTFGRCAVCEKLSFAARDASGRCETCSSGNARIVDCGCGFLAANEACACSPVAITRCPDCYEPTHASVSNDDGLCKRCMWLRGITPITEAA